MAAKTFLNTALTIFLLFLLTCTSATVHAKTIHVDNNGPADFSNIQAAINDANDGDIIIVNPGTYTGDGNRDIDFKGKAITVRGTDPNNPNIVATTVIDCQGSDEDYHRGFYFHSGEDENSILEGLKITNGFHGDGAGICCRESSPTIRNNIITGNETCYDSDGGAGIACWKGASPTIANNIISDNICAPGGGGGGIRCLYLCSPAITNCTFSRNSPGGIEINNSNPTISNCTFEGNFGGGVSSSSLSSPIFINCTFIGNSSPTGGGMHIYESSPILINCSFIQNVATSNGGGLNIHGWDTASPTLINCTFAGNSAGNYGGGMYCRDNTNSMLVNCTFTGNSADDAGGAVYNYGYDRSVRITLNNCTFSGNSAANGNDLACDSPYGPPSYVQAANCVIWNGENPIRNNDGSTITINYSDVHGGWPGKGNIDADPCFVDPDGYDNILGTEDDNLRLSTGSPCIDAGDPNYVAGPNETDLDGNPRVIAGRIDMGAYEFQSYLILYVDADATGANDGSSWTDAFNYLQDALAAAYSGDEIRVAQGIYKPDQGGGQTPGDRYATFQLVNGVTIEGGYAGIGQSDPNARDIELYETILSGDLNGDDGPDFSNNGENSRHIVTGNGAKTTILDGFTVTRGNSIGHGAGMYNMYSSPTVINCTFTGNEGGGMYNLESLPTLINCSLTCNLAIGGGGMYNNNSGTVLTNCIFSENVAVAYESGYGGGMYNDSSNPVLTNCIFTRNMADTRIPDHGGGEGGGMFNDRSSNPTLTNCTFTGNKALCGGAGMGNRSSSPMLNNCIFTGNLAIGQEDRWGEGGGMFNENSCPALTNCTFNGNAAGSRGGGITSFVSVPAITNCSFSGNIAKDKGGSIYNFKSSMTIAKCTFSGNAAGSCGAGICNVGSDATLSNCILWGDTAAQGSEIYLVLSIDYYGQQPSTIDVDYTDVDGGAAGVYVGTDCTLNWGTGNINAGPLFRDPDGNDDILGTEDDNLRIFTGSPCIDAGDPNYIAGPNETDLDGRPRVLDGDNDGVLQVDMGAYEKRFAISAEARILPQTINLASKGNWITCYIWLPDEYDATDIEPNSVLLKDDIQPEQFSVDQQQQLATARFNREDVQPILGVGDIDLTITGRLTNGTVFEAADTIKVINKAGKD